MSQRSLKIGNRCPKGYQFWIGRREVLTLPRCIWSGKSTILISLPVFWMRRLEMSTWWERINDVPTNKRDVHTVFQSYALFPIWRSLKMWLSLFVWKKVDKAEIERRVSEVLKMVQLAGFEKRSIQNYRRSTPAGSHCPGYYQWTTRVL